MGGWGWEGWGGVGRWRGEEQRWATKQSHDGTSIIDLTTKMYYLSIRVKFYPTHDVICTSTYDSSPHGIYTLLAFPLYTKCLFDFVFLTRHMHTVPVDKLYHIRNTHSFHPLVFVILTVVPSVSLCHWKPFHPFFLATSCRFVQSLQQYASIHGFPSIHEQLSVLAVVITAKPSASAASF